MRRKVCPKGRWDKRGWRHCSGLSAVLPRSPLLDRRPHPPASGKVVSSAFSGNYPPLKSIICLVMRGSSHHPVAFSVWHRGPSLLASTAKATPAATSPVGLHSSWTSPSAQSTHFLPASQGPQSRSAVSSGEQSGITLRGPTPIRSGSGTLALRAQGWLQVHSPHNPPTTACLWTGLPTVECAS